MKAKKDKQKLKKAMALEEKKGKQFVDYPEEEVHGED